MNTSLPFKIILLTLLCSYYEALPLHSKDRSTETLTNAMVRCMSDSIRANFL